MTNTINSSSQKQIRMPVPVDSLITILHNIQLKIDSAAGAATALELRLRIIAQIEEKVRDELKKNTKEPFHQAALKHLISAVLEVFQDKLDATEQSIIKQCRPPRNKTAHGSFAELMIELAGEASGRQLDNRTLKPLPLAEDDIIEGAICIERNGGLGDFSKLANRAASILEEKIIRHLKP